MTDDPFERIVEETETAISKALDGLGPTELQVLAFAMIAKAAVIGATASTRRRQVSFRSKGRPTGR